MKTATKIMRALRMVLMMICTYLATKFLLATFGWAQIEMSTIYASIGFMFICVLAIAMIVEVPDGDT
jgi:hypothetical protein